MMDSLFLLANSVWLLVHTCSRWRVIFAPVISWYERLKMPEICSSSLAPFCLHMWPWIFRESLWQSDFDTISFKSSLQEWKRKYVCPWLLTESTLSFRLKKRKEKEKMTSVFLLVEYLAVEHVQPWWCISDLHGTKPSDDTDNIDSLQSDAAASHWSPTGESSKSG